jgi:hypothetical protein
MGFDGQGPVLYALAEKAPWPEACALDGRSFYGLYLVISCSGDCSEPEIPVKKGVNAKQNNGRRMT